MKQVYFFGDGKADGAQTMREAISDLIPGANFISRPRLSKLTYAGEKKITRLPSRSAVIGFSAAEVYSIAELMRRRRGGTAVVLGALSPTGDWLTIYDDDWKLLWNSEGSSALYDLASDIGETKNLADDPSAKPQRAALEQALERHHVELKSGAAAAPAKPAESKPTEAPKPAAVLALRRRSSLSARVCRTARFSSSRITCCATPLSVSRSCSVISRRAGTRARARRDRPG